MKTVCILLKWEFHRDEASNNPTLKSISPEKHLQPMMFLFYCTSNGIALKRCKALCTMGLWIRQCEVRMTLYSDFKLTFKPVSTILKYFSIYFSKNKGEPPEDCLSRKQIVICCNHWWQFFASVLREHIIYCSTNVWRYVVTKEEKFQWSPFPGNQILPESELQFMNICRINQQLFTYRIHPGSGVCTAMLSK